MASLNACLRLQDFDDADLVEINAHIERAGGEAAGVKSYLESLEAEKQALGKEIDAASDVEAKRQHDVEDLKALVDAGASRDVLDNHPAVIAAIIDLESRPETISQKGYGSVAWRKNRTYMFEGREVVGTDEALDLWVEGAKRLAWEETGLPPQSVKANKELTIILGPPAAGKSTIANEIAVAGRAAIIDADEIKKTIPEFDGGIGAGAVHEESSDLSGLLEAAILADGTNAVFPKVGKSAGSIEATIARAKAAGYSVRLLNMAVTKENAYRRMIGRFISKGRIIPPAFVDLVGESPSATFREIKAKGLADGYAEIDNNVGIGEKLVVTERQGQDPIGNTRLNLQESGGKAVQTEQGRPGNPRATEETAEGQQFLIEGVAPIRPVDRLAAAQHAPMRGGDAPMQEGGLFDEGARAQQSLFDEVPVGKLLDDDGRVIPETMSRDQVAAMLDAEDEFLDQLEVCL